MIRYYLRDDAFTKNMLRIAVPVAAQNLLITSLSMIDTIMIGRLGEVEIAAVSLANQLFFLTLLFFFGITSGGAVFIAQYWGKKDIPGIRSTIGLTLLIAQAGAICGMIVSVTAPQAVLSFFTSDQAVISTGASYLRIVGISYLFTGGSVLYSTVLRSIEEPKLALLATSISLILNTGLNYILIFGAFGLPALGVIGAAIATTVSRGVELVFILIIVYRRGNAAAASLQELFAIPKSFIPRFFKTSVPVVFNELAWATGMIMYQFVFARMGTEYVAAYNIAFNANNLVFVVFIGTSNAAAVLVGKKIGQGNYQTALEYGNRFGKLSAWLGIVVGILLAGLSFVLPAFFNVSPLVKESAKLLLQVGGVLIPFKAFSVLLVIGVFRSGGDTTFALFLDLTGVWCIGVPMALFGGLFLGLPVHIVFAMLTSEEIYKSVLGFYRLKSGKWLHDVTRGNLSAKNLLDNSSIQ